MKGAEVDLISVFADDMEKVVRIIYLQKKKYNIRGLYEKRVKSYGYLVYVTKSIISAYG